MTPILGVFNLIGSLYYTLTHSDGPVLYADKIGVSLSHLVPEILGPKVGLIFQQNSDFKHFVFLHDFQSNLTPFYIALKSF